MLTKYFKNMFQNVSQGVLYSIGIADSENKNSWTACYICAGENAELSKRERKDCFSGCGETVRLVAAGDGSDATIEWLMEFVRKNRVEQVILPENNEKAVKELQKAGVKRVVEMKPGSSLYDEKDFWQFKIHCYGNDEGSYLVMFTGEVGIDWKTMDCLMSVRTFDSNKCCNAGIDMDNMVCCAKCGLYNDFELCKGHNQNSGKGYMAGTILFGNLPMTDYAEAVKKDFFEVRDKIRYLSMTGNYRKAEKELCAWIEEARAELNHYYILASGCTDTGDFITDILSRSGRSRVYLTGEKCGVCGSGFFISREK